MDHKKLIGERIKALREDCELSLETLAEKLGVPAEFLNRVEEGAAEVSVSVLHQIGRICGVDLTTLLTGESPRLHSFTVTPAGKGVDVHRRAEYAYQSLAANFAGRKAEPFLVTVPPGKNKEVKKYHHDGQEFNYVLKGEIRFFIGEHEALLKEGDSIYFDSAQDHAMQVVGDEPALFLAVIL